MGDRLSASKLDLAQCCLHWARPDVPWPERGDTPHADLGSALHEAAARFVEGHSADIGAIAERWTLTDDQIDKLVAMYARFVDWWPGFSECATNWRAEVPYVWDTARDAARELPSRGHRDYGERSAGDLFGTADLVGHADGAVVVVDLKTGRTAPSPTTMQLAHNALCAASVAAIGRARVVIAHVTPDAVWTRDMWLDELDFAAVSAQFATMKRRLPLADPEPGPHCTGLYCPALATCPTTQTQIAHVAEALTVPQIPMAGDIESDDDARILLAGLPRFEAWMKERWEALKRRAASQPVPLGNGRRWGKVEKSRRDVDVSTATARDALRTALGIHAEAAIETKSSASLTSIRRAAQMIRDEAKTRGEKPPTIKSIEARAVAALDAAGAMRARTYTTFDVIEVAADDAAAE